MYILYNTDMKTLSTTQARKNISSILNKINETGEVFAIGRREKIEVLIIKFPSLYNKEVSDITNINANSISFDFLKNEPELYSLSDLKKQYV